METQTNIQEPVPSLPTVKPAKKLAKTKLEKPTLPEKVRAELNIEKWPSIWQPSRSKNQPELRVLEREYITPEGNTLRSRIEIGYTQLGTLTTEEQKMLYGLVKVWEEGNKPLDHVYISDRMLQRVLKKKWGTNVIDAITKSLRKLRTIPLEWVNSYEDRTTAGKVLRERVPFTFLSDLKIIEQDQDGVVNKAVGYFKFDDHILNNLLANHTKPVLLDTILSFTTDIGVLLYTHADLMLADKNRYERRSRELFDDLGLKNNEYAHQYERRRAIERAIKEMQGVPLSTGVLSSVTLEKTKDRTDYKVVFIKGARAKQVEEESLQAVLPSVEPAPVVINYYTQKKDELTLQAEELVQEFHKTFHGVENSLAKSKEVNQAISVIAQHSIEVARYFIRYSFQLASETGYKPDTFGGIMQYVDRARAEFEKSRIAREHSERQQLKQVAIEEKREREKAEAENLLDALSSAEYQELFEEAKQELLRENPFMAGKNPDSALHQAAVRAGMLRLLQTYPRSITPVESTSEVSAKQLPLYLAVDLKRPLLKEPKSRSSNRKN